MKKASLKRPFCGDYKLTAELKPARSHQNLLEQAMRPSKVQRLCTALHTQATEQAPQVDFDGVFTDIELFCDFTVT
jgi:hypothetical protein